MDFATFYEKHNNYYDGFGISKPTSDVRSATKQKVDGPYDRITSIKSVNPSEPTKQEIAPGRIVKRGGLNGKGVGIKTANNTAGPAPNQLPHNSTEQIIDAINKGTKQQQPLNPRDIQYIQQKYDVDLRGLTQGKSLQINSDPANRVAVALQTIAGKPQYILRRLNESYNRNDYLLFNKTEDIDGEILYIVTIKDSGKRMYYKDPARKILHRLGGPAITHNTDVRWDPNAYYIDGKKIGSSLPSSSNAIIFKEAVAKYLAKERAKKEDPELEHLFDL